MKKIRFYFTIALSLTLMLFTQNSFSQAKRSLNENSNLVEISAKNGEEISKLIEELDNKVSAYQAEVSETDKEEMSFDDLADLMTGINVFDDNQAVNNSLLAEKRSAYLDLFKQFSTVSEKSKESKENVDYDAKLTERQKYVLAMSPGLAFLMRKVGSDRYGFIVNVDGKRGLIVEDKSGFYGSVELKRGDNPISKGNEIELRGDPKEKRSCYKYGFKSKFTGSYWSKWMWHSMGFAGYSYSCCWITIQGYAAYAKVASFKRWWIFPRFYYASKSVNLKGNVYNHKCSKPRYISKSNSNSSWFCGTKKIGLGRSRIKTNSLKSDASCSNIGSSHLAIK